MRICYWSKNYKETDTAGNKAKTDIEAILAAKGYHNVGFRQTRYKNKIAGFLITFLGVAKTPFSLRKNDIMIVQYPLKKYYTLLCNIAHFRKSKVITVIHDLGSFRRRRLTPEQEAELLNHSDYVIAHNNSMKKLLNDNGVVSPVGSLRIFDYLSDSKPDNNEIPVGKYTVIMAGSLYPRKSAFLYKLNGYIHAYHLDLYGVGFDDQAAQGIQGMEYKGYVPSDHFITSVKGHFGLVWDGDSISECSGIAGEYLKYNNPHKASLYVRTHLPLIVWEKSAMATFVKENNIGLCIDSLENLDNILAGLSEESYTLMKNNIEKISKRLSQGYYILHAVEEAKNYFENEQY